MKVIRTPKMRKKLYADGTVRWKPPSPDWQATA